MTNRDSRRIAQLLRVVQFLDHHADAFGPEVHARRRRLHTMYERAAELRVRLTVRLRDAVALAATARAELRTKHLLPLARYAKPVFSDEPLVRQHLKVPHKSASADTIVAAARGMVDALVPYRDHLAECDIDVGRLTRLEAAIVDYERLARAAVESSREHALGTRELRAILSRARGDVLGIDAAIRAERRELAGVWRGAVRMHKRMGRPVVREKGRQPKRSLSSGQPVKSPIALEGCTT